MASSRHSGLAEEPSRSEHDRLFALRHVGGVAARGPKGARIGDVIVAERTRWRVTGLDQQRREVICKLLAGSRVLRRFRARRIERVERPKRPLTGKRWQQERLPL
jgi:hypothetical protein